MHDIGEIHVFKRQIVKSIKIEDTAADRKQQKRAVAESLKKFKTEKRREIDVEL